MPTPIRTSPPWVKGIIPPFEAAESWAPGGPNPAALGTLPWPPVFCNCLGCGLLPPPWVPLPFPPRLSPPYLYPAAGDSSEALPWPNPAPPPIGLGAPVHDWPLALLPPPAAHPAVGRRRCRPVLLHVGCPRRRPPVLLHAPRRGCRRLGLSVGGVVSAGRLCGPSRQPALSPLRGLGSLGVSPSPLYPYTTPIYMQLG